MRVVRTTTALQQGVRELMAAAQGRAELVGVATRLGERLGAPNQRHRVVVSQEALADLDVLTQGLAYHGQWAENHDQSLGVGTPIWFAHSDNSEVVVENVEEPNDLVDRLPPPLAFFENPDWLLRFSSEHHDIYKELYDFYQFLLIRCVEATVTDETIEQLHSIRACRQTIKTAI